MESISSIFLNARLGCLDEKPSQDGIDLIEASQIVLGKDMLNLITKPPFWKYFSTPGFKRMDSASEKLLYIAKKHVERAAANFKENPGVEGKKSVLEKLIISNSGELDMPVVMAVDAMMAGIDTTARCGKTK